MLAALFIPSASLLRDRRADPLARFIPTDLSCEPHGAPPININVLGLCQTRCWRATTSPCCWRAYGISASLPALRSFQALNAGDGTNAYLDVTAWCGTTCRINAEAFATNATFSLYAFNSASPPALDSYSFKIARIASAHAYYAIGKLIMGGINTLMV